MNPSQLRRIHYFISENLYMKSMFFLTTFKNYEQEEEFWIFIFF
jgi:hypothetical protein